ncbi:Josephin-domain-containing protein [Crepidotus variabilis]|uniref:ubiquitinyl hydrolase 1 n=1 Tax=Crepidotus variabilis TaxID=179855 RepID=A0A9P6EN56_9AGAR|nr:Josephin-domain-containing protein [Crepidotus variabilis]
MAGLESLLPHIYHEKQQAGSMLCAQHALNNFTAPDLSEIGRGLDDLEESYDDSNTGGTSTNMDDTGFFSVQVLDHALNVWGLTLARWRSEAMRPYQQHPENQLGFILNLEQHWFTLRRFGDANPDMDLDEGNGHWFNLNSFLKDPEWVSRTYLGMVLQQSEAEGYSVFVVTQSDPNAPLALPRTQADMIASSLPEPRSSARAGISTTRVPQKYSSTDATGSQKPVDHFENEDYELQAALQASLMQAGSGPTSASSSSSSLSAIPPPILAGEGPNISPTRTTTADPPVPYVPPPLIPSSRGGLNLPGHADLDPVTASMERNRVLLQRMREQQEFAAREMWQDAELTPEEQTAFEERRAQRQREEDDEAEQLKKAIEESEALSRQMEQEQPSVPSTALPKASASGSNRIYDDEDEELQAALRASLEEHQGQSSDVTSPTQAPPGQDMETDDDYSIMSESTTLEPPAPAAAPSIDEVRKARLARFGL